MNNKEAILKLLLLMAFADKIYMEEEKDLITKISTGLGISKEKMYKIVDEVEKTENITEQCRETAKKIESQEDRDKTIKLLSELKRQIRKNASPRHVPDKIIAVNDIPRTKNGKIVELAVKNIIEGNKIKNVQALANPEVLDDYKNIKELQN